MKHCIIVKWNEGEDKAALLEKARILFSRCGEAEGAQAVRIVPNCVDRPNRYDLAVVLDVSPKSLSVWDASALHREWKESFGPFIAKKAIFDFDPLKEDLL